MKSKHITKYIITAIFVIAWLYIAFINKMIVIDPLKKFVLRKSTFEETRDEIAANYPVNLEEKYDFINLNGLFVKMTGGRKCNNIIKLNDGSLTSVSQPKSTADNAQKAIELGSQLKEMGIDFLYVQAPFKMNSELLPYGLEDATDNTIDGFLSEIEGKVDYLDLRPYITDTEEHLNQYFYKTDHHWNPLGAFKAFQVISEYLQAKYPDEHILGEYQNSENWDIHRKEDWFLGSRGKRTGIYFGGVDDLIWLTPKFDTDMSFANVYYKNEFYYGDFNKANIREEFIQERDYFLKNAYCVYIGGDYPLVQHRNAQAPVDKKVLIIKDSFVLPLQAYFSTVFSELDVVDMRFYTAGSLYEYIDESRPDLVMMNFNGTGVAQEELFGTGVNKYISDGNETTAVQMDTVSIAADPENENNYVSVYDDIEAGKRYTLMCDSVDVLEGNPEGISIKVYDEAADKFHDCSIWDIAYCEKKGSYTWTFTAPSDIPSLKLLIYSGIASHTNGNAITLHNVRLIQK